MLGRALGPAGTAVFQRLAVAAAQARAQWVSAATGMVSDGQRPSPAQIAQLSTRRAAYEELIEVYDGMRRMIERRYLHYQPSR